jgi:tetratricopeptide (TPR) repeat protein/predicted Ser/Thr protein kinase
MEDEKQAREPALPVAGSTLAGRYTVLEQLGQGGMGVVFAAYDVRLDRRVALKLLTAQRSGSASAQARLLREAKAMARLSHPHVVAVYDAGVLEDGRVFISMEMVEGQTLRQWLLERTRAWQEILEVYLSAGRGLAAAHAAGLVHRDFKPDNVLVGKDGRVRVTDFGVAQVDSPCPSELAQPTTVPADSPSSALTQPGMLPGTLRYMAPEVLAGEPADARSDLFSFCMALYEALFRQAPFAGEDAESRARSMAEGRLTPPPSRSDVPPWATRAVLQGLEIDPRQRPASMEALLRALSRDPARAHARWLALGTVVAAALVLAAVSLHQYAQHRALLCQGGPQRLTGVWDEAVRERLRQAFSAIGEPHAREVFLGVRQVLDAYASEWTDQHREACESTRLRGEQPEPVLMLRMACLERRLQELDALGKVLTQVDAQSMPQALRAAQGLPRLRDCKAVEALMEEVPPPEGAETRRAVEALRGELAHVQALTLTGQYKQASETARTTLERARAIPYPPLHTEALFHQGLADSYLDDPRALPTFTEAALTALAQRQDALATRAAIHITQELHTLGRYEQAEWWQAQAQALVSRLRERGELEALLEAVRGIGHGRRGEHAQALAALERGRQLTERTFGPGHYRLTLIEGNMAVILSMQGRWKQSFHHDERVANAMEKELGPRHPRVVHSWMNLANLQVNLGLLPEAQRMLDRVDSALPQALPATSWAYVTWHIIHGSLLMEQGRMKQALARIEQARELVRSLGAADSERALLVQLEHGQALLGNGRCREALTPLAQLAERTERGMDKQSHLAGATRLLLARCHESLGRTDEALEHHERALALARKADEGQGFLSAQARIRKGSLLVRLGRANEALELARQSHPLLLETVGERASQVSDSLWLQGEALLALDRATEAVPLLEQALRVREQGGMDPNGMARIRFLLARALATPGQMPERVRELVALAREDYARSEVPPQRERDELERWVRVHLRP